MPDSFPGLILLLTIISIVGQGLLQLILVLGISGGIGGSRVLRGAVIGIKENDYFLAARAIGSNSATTLRRHVLPNVMPIVIISFSITIGGVMLTEAAVSFLGFGLSREIPSWGGLLSQEGRAFMEQAPCWLSGRHLPDYRHLQSKHVWRRTEGPHRPRLRGGER